MYNPAQITVAVFDLIYSRVPDSLVPGLAAGVGDPEHGWIIIIIINNDDFHHARPWD